jgi:DNA-binding LytR/AlgR family response regulator
VGEDMKLTIAVCDDENITLKINCTYIKELSQKYKVDANVIGFSSGDDLLDYMEHNEDIDMAFLDVDMRGMNGIQTAGMMVRKNPRTVIIFITGHKEFAYDAFTVEAFSFLVKPIDPERLDRIYKKAVLQVSDLMNRRLRSSLIITEDNIKKKINQSAILYIERIEARSVIVTKTTSHGVYESITSLENRLEDNFLRINQGIIVNLNEVAGVQGTQVTMKAGEIFPIGRTYLKQVKKSYLNYPQV